MSCEVALETRPLEGKVEADEACASAISLATCPRATSPWPSRRRARRAPADERICSEGRHSMTGSGFELPAEEALRSRHPALERAALESSSYESSWTPASSKCPPESSVAAVASSCGCRRWEAPPRPTNLVAWSTPGPSARKQIGKRGPRTPRVERSADTRARLPEPISALGTRTDCSGSAWKWCSPLPANERQSPRTARNRSEQHDPRLGLYWRRARGSEGENERALRGPVQDSRTAFTDPLGGPCDRCGRLSGVVEVREPRDLETLAASLGE